jgi:hypothetical protein
VRVGDELAGARQVAHGDRCCERSDTVALAPDVSGPSAERLVLQRVDRGRCGVPQGTEPLGRGLGLGAAQRVRGVRQAPRLARLDDPHGDVVGKRDRSGLLGGAVDEECVAGDPRRRTELVHDPARDPRGDPLGALAPPGECERVVLAPECERHGQLECRRRREPAARRDARADRTRQTRRWVELGCDAGDVAAPLGSYCGGVDDRQLDDDRFVELFRAE